MAASPNRRSPMPLPEIGAPRGSAPAPPCGAGPVSRAPKTAFPEASSGAPLPSLARRAPPRPLNLPPPRSARRGSSFTGIGDPEPQRPGAHGPRSYCFEALKILLASTLPGKFSKRARFLEGAHREGLGAVGSPSEFLGAVERLHFRVCREASRKGRILPSSRTATSRCARPALPPLCKLSQPFPNFS